MLLPPDVTKFKIWEIEMFNFSTNKWAKMGNGSEASIQCLHDLDANVKYKLRARVLLLNDTWTEYSEEFEFRTLNGM
jgi:hypothetical protein